MTFGSRGIAKGPITLQIFTTKSLKLSLFKKKLSYKYFEKKILNVNFNYIVVGVTFDTEATKMFHISDKKLYLKNIRTCPGKHVKTPK